MNEHYQKELEDAVRQKAMIARNEMRSKLTECLRNTRMSIETEVRVYSSAEGSAEWNEKRTTIDHCIKAICERHAALTAEDCWRRLGREHAAVLNDTQKA